MKYYFIAQDEKLADAPQVINWYQKLNVEDVQMGTYHRIKNRTVLEVKANKELYFPEVLFHPCFMVSKKIKEILKSYEPNLHYKEIILLDMQNGKTSVYYIPYLEEIDCLVKEQSRFGNYQGLIKEGAIDREQVEDWSVFYLKHNSKKYYVVRHDLLESMLRRDTIVKIKELKVI